MTMSRPTPPRVSLTEIAVLAKAGVLRPTWPSRVARQLLALKRFGPTLAGAYAAAAARAPERCAVRDEDSSCTYGELDRRVRQLEAGMRAYGLGPNDSIAILAHNSVQFVETLVTTSRLGADTLLLSTFLSPPQVREILIREQPSLIILDSDLAPLLAQAPPGIPFLFTRNTDSDREMATLETLAAAAPPVSARGGRPVTPHRRGKLIVLTSGTTGTPRGAHRPAPPGLSVPAAVLSRLPLGVGSKILIAPPLFHTWGLGVLQLAPAVSSTVVLRRQSTPEVLLETLETERCDGMVVVPVMLERLLSSGLTISGDVRKSLRLVASCGAPLTAEVSSRFQNAYGDVLYNVYGSTEVSWATIATPKDLREVPGTAGRAPRGTRLALLGENDREVLPGQVGRIFVANALLFEGYSGGQDAKERYGLLSTGDLGVLDEKGRLTVLGREDGLVISGAEKIYPLEVEEVIATITGVKEVAVTGLPDAEMGQRLVAYVVCKDGFHLSPQAIQDAVRQRLARYAVPKDVWFLGRLPRSATGKVVPRMLPPVPEGEFPSSGPVTVVSDR